MNRILALIFCFGLAMTQVVYAENNDQDQRAKKKAQKPTPAAQQEKAPAAQPKPAVQQSAPVVKSHQQSQRGSSDRRLQDNNDRAAMNATTARRLNRNQTTVVQQNQNTRIVRQNNVVIRNRNSFAEACRRNWHVRHDRDWWRHHFTRFVIFGGGYYYWNAGYWYPAYGYDPGYSSYVYDEPIYGYNELPPGQVIVNVQTELRREGYYYGAIDGLLGPMTRSALARYQATHGLVVTKAIDEPTLQLLGIV